MSEREKKRSPTSTGTKTILRDFTDRALDDILAVRDEVKSHREEMLVRERASEERESKREDRRRQRDAEHDRELNELRAELMAVKAEHVKELAELKAVHTKELAGLEARLTAKAAELEKAQAVSQAKSGGLAGLASGGGVVGIVEAIKWLFM